MANEVYSAAVKTVEESKTCPTAQETTAVLLTGCLLSLGMLTDVVLEIKDILIVSGGEKPTTIN